MLNYTKIAHMIEAIKACDKAGNTEWSDKHSTTLDSIIKNGPSGAGIDCGTKLDDSSTGDKLVLVVEFHHMNDNGYYDGWTGHKIIVTPSLMHGIDLKITGRNKNDIKEYLYDIYAQWLNEEFV